MEENNEKIKEIFNETKKANDGKHLDEIIYYVYKKLNTDKPFYEMKNKILKANNINEYKYYLKDVNENLIEYVENKIFPQYELNDKAHGIVHIKEVIRRSFALNDTFNLNLDKNMIYAISACHDINKYVNSDIHEKLAAEAFINDENMKKFFSDSERNIIKEAIEDHRSSKWENPRSIYGKLISSADRNTTIEMVFIRSFFVALGNSKNNKRDLNIEEYLDYTINRLSKRYSEENPENMFFEDEIYKVFLHDMRELLKDTEKFKNEYCKINNINNRNCLVKDYDKKEI